MDNYFDEVMMQIELIEAEMGTIRKIASMAADSVVKGGRIYCYSRFSSVSQDANTRRSGLSITRGIFDRNGELWDGQKSVVFKGGHIEGLRDHGHPQAGRSGRPQAPGVFQEAGDERCLHRPPMTRGMHEPDGPTIPKENRPPRGQDVRYLRPGSPYRDSIRRSARPRASCSTRCSGR